MNTEAAKTVIFSGSKFDYPASASFETKYHAFREWASHSTAETDARLAKETIDAEEKFPCFRSVKQ